MARFILDVMKDNKLIAKFMGMDYHHNDKSMMVKETPQGNEVVFIDSLEYDTSWDWLRPVMVKIDTYANSDSLSIAEYEDYRNKYPLIAEASIHDDISETYKQVVEFIKSIQLPF